VLPSFFRVDVIVVVKVPVTDKEESKAFVVLSGHDPSIHNWSAVAAIDTIVILMGTIKLAVIADALVSGGKPTNTPVAIVSWANTPRQRVIKGCLDDIADVASRSKSALSPAIIIVGAVARHARD
jgi:uroporphyrinogen III methyltransferase/synthase